MSDEYESNAFADKQPKEEPVVEKKDIPESEPTIPVKVHKRTAFQQAVDSFVSEDLKKVKDYIIWDVLIPAAKNALSNIIKTGSDIIIYGASPNQNKNSGSRPNYRQPRVVSNYPRDDQPARTERRGYSYDEVIFPEYTQCKQAFDELAELADSCGWVRIADFYQVCTNVLRDSVDLRAAYTDAWWGWDKRDFEAVCMMSYGDGWVIRFPSPKYRR